MPEAASAGVPARVAADGLAPAVPPARTPPGAEDPAAMEGAPPGAIATCG